MPHSAAHPDADTAQANVSPAPDPVLIIGGSGIVGARAAATLRELHPELPVLIGGRDLGRAQAVAERIGNARGVAVDLTRRDLGLRAGQPVSAVVPFVKDDGLHTLDFALDRGIPYLSTSSASFEMAPEVARFAQRPDRAPVLFASHWLAGIATLPTLVFAREFAKVGYIRLSAVLDEQDMGGPAAAADYERIVTSAAATQVLEDGRWRWIRGDEANARFRRTDGAEVEATAYSPLDVVGLAASTGARSLRLDLHYGESSHRTQGGHYSTEMIIEMQGEDAAGRPLHARHELVHPQGQGPVTAIGIVTAVERLLGLDGAAPPAPGLYLLNTLIDPDRYLAQLQRFGTQIRRTGM